MSFIMVKDEKSTENEHLNSYPQLICVYVDKTTWIVLWKVLG